MPDEIGSPDEAYSELERERESNAAQLKSVEERLRRLLEDKE